jgi:hypothetical protein
MNIELNSDDFSEAVHIINIYSTEADETQNESVNIEYFSKDNLLYKPLNSRGGEEENMGTIPSNMLMDSSNNVVGFVSLQSEKEELMNPFDEMDGNSPVLSNYGSGGSDEERGSLLDVNSDVEFDNNEIVYIRPNEKMRYRKLSLKDIERSLDKYYNAEVDNKYSNEIDILTTYVRGQKNLYIQSKRVTQIKLDILMFLSLGLTTLIALITPFYLSSEFISGMNALASFFIGLINYLKLESSCEKYFQIANEYDKLESSLEICNNKLMFIKNEQEKSFMVMKKLKTFEAKIQEIKLINTVLIPNEVRIIFPVICHINIMSFIKKTEIYKKDMLNKLKDIKNEIRFILYKWEQESRLTNQKNNKCTSEDLKPYPNEVSNYRWNCPSKFQTVYNVDSSDDIKDDLLSSFGMKYTNRQYQFIRNKEKARLHYLYNIKNSIRDEILNFRSTYSFLDDLFMKEIKDAEANRYFVYLPFCFLKSPILSKIHLKDANTVILKHFYSIGLISEL